MVDLCRPKSMSGSVVDDYESKFENLYREIFSDLKIDREESKELADFFKETNKPFVRKPRRASTLKLRSLLLGLGTLVFCAWSVYSFL